MNEQNFSSFQEPQGATIDQLLKMLEQLLGSVQKQKTETIASQPNYQKFLENMCRENYGRRFLQGIQNQLIKSIVKREIDQELWDMYVELVGNC